MKISSIIRTGFLIVFVLACLAIGVTILLNGWTAAWYALHVPTLSPPFADMRTVQGALVSAAQGFNPQLKNPGDPWGRVLNYPIIWFWIAKFFQLDIENNFLVFIGVYILAYLISCFMLLRKTSSLYLLVAMFSGASLLAVERGNNDILAFVLVFAAISYAQGYWRGFFILLAAVLKVYPAFLAVSLVKKPKILILLVLILAVYFLFNIGELQILQAGNTALTDPAAVFASYGFATNMQIFRQFFMPGQSDPTYTIIKVVFIILSLGLIALISRVKSLNPSSDEGYKTDLFIAGGTVFSCTYLITSNWDYRLIFLLLCIPLILSIKGRFLRHAILIAVLVSSNANILCEFIGLQGMFLAAFCKYFVFIMVGASLVQVLIGYLPLYSLTSIKGYFTQSFAGLPKKVNQ